MILHPFGVPIHAMFEVQRSGNGRFLPSTKLAKIVGNTGMN
jgi:hypothetical protein